MLLRLVGTLCPAHARPTKFARLILQVHHQCINSVCDTLRPLAACPYCPPVCRFTVPIITVAPSEPHDDNGLPPPPPLRYVPWPSRPTAACSAIHPTTRLVSASCTQRLQSNYCSPRNTIHCSSLMHALHQHGNMGPSLARCRMQLPIRHRCPAARRHATMHAASRANHTTRTTHTPHAAPAAPQDGPQLQICPLV